MADFHRIVVLPSTDASSSIYPSIPTYRVAQKKHRTESDLLYVRLCTKDLRSVTPLSFSPFKVRALPRFGRPSRRELRSRVRPFASPLIQSYPVFMDGGTDGLDGRMDGWIEEMHLPTWDGRYATPLTKLLVLYGASAKPAVLNLYPHSLLLSPSYFLPRGDACFCLGSV